ncbi:MAG: metal ABC transporter permease [Alphaproteobacteria bacterium]|nr:metal ABC transporter permease [Alphaproteobacteria bacterium]
MHEVFIAPFLEFAFMRRALAACLALALGCGPVGVFLVLRRMSLMGDAITHAVLPGAAIGFVFGGLSLPALSLGGFAAGLSVALLAGLVARHTRLKEDASFAGAYLIALAAGVLIIVTEGSAVDLVHILFGTILAVDDASLLLIASVSTVTVLALAVIYRALVIECFDPGFLRAVGSGGTVYHMLFLALAVLNLVAGFQALGTLLSLGLLLLPATAAMFWTQRLSRLMAIASGFAFLSGYAGLVVSYRWDLPSGPVMVLAAGLFYVVSMALGPEGSLRTRLFPRPHLAG